MAAKKSSSSGGESNTGLIVSLVLFVLLTIGLGVTTYLGYSGQSELQTKATQAEAKAGDNDKAKQREETLKVALKIAAGVESEADRTTFGGRKAQFTTEINQQLGALKGLPKWDINSPINRPTKNFQDVILDTQQAVKAATDAQKARENDLAEARKQFEADKQDLATKLKTAEKKLADANTAVLAAQQQRAGGADDASKKIKELSDQVAQLTLDKTNLDVEKTREIRKLQEKIDSIAKVRESLLARVGPILDKIAAVAEARPELREVSELHELLVKQFESPVGIANDTPKGKIIKVDRQRELVYIDLGTADYLRPQLSFSVMPPGSTGKSAAGRARKGALEIVSVLEPHLSTAKIVEEASRYRDPLMPGDLLFNPAWSPSQREHVALAGIIDLNGDNIDDTPDLIRALEKQGVIVDAWLDLKDRQIKGPGMSERTTWLIIGERPVLSQSLLAAEGNPVAEAAREILGKMTELEVKAKEMSVQRVPYRKFLSLVGFKLPKGGADYGASSYLRGITGSIKATEPDDKPK